MTPQTQMLLDDLSNFDALLGTLILYISRGRSNPHNLLSGMCEHAASMLGLDLLKFESLRVRHAIYQKDPSSCLSDGPYLSWSQNPHEANFEQSGYLRVCINLAEEYVSLGRYDLAGTIFANALTIVEQPGLSVSNETRLAFYLRYAAATAANGNLDQALAAYAEATTISDVLSAEPTPSNIPKSLHRVGTIIRAALAADAFAAIQSGRVSGSDSFAKLLPDSFRSRTMRLLLSPATCKLLGCGTERLICSKRSISRKLSQLRSYPHDLRILSKSMNLKKLRKCQQTKEELSTLFSGLLPK